MEVKGIWVATSKYSQLHQVYKVLINKDSRNKFIEILDLDTHFKKLNKKKINVPKRNSKSLIEGDEYYINKINETNNPENLKKFNTIILDKASNLKNENTLTFKKELKKRDDKERERFYIIWIEKEDTNYYLFVYINSRDIVRKKKFLDGNYSLNKSSAIIDVSHGVPIPEEITSTYSFETEKLYVHQVYKFERMLFLHEAYKESAKEQIEGFIKEKNFVGEESYKVKGLDNDKVKNMILESVRFTKRIAGFDKKQSKHPIENIEEAVQLLPKEHDKVLFCHDTKTITVNKLNVGTFVAVIHDSIVRRLISKEVELI